MYAFSLMSMPLSFLVLAAWTFRPDTSSNRSFARGALFGIPAVVIWSLAGPLYPSVWGSPLLILGFLARFWVLPFGLTTVAYAVSVGFSGLSRGLDYERTVAFFAGSLSVFGIGHAVSSWGDPSRVYALVVPCLLVASAVAFPVLLEEAAKDGFPGALKYLALALAGFAVAATGTALFFMRLEWLGMLVSALYGAGAVFVGLHRLRKIGAA